MSKKRRQYTSKYKFNLALEAAKGSKTLAQLSSDTGVHPNQIRQWKAQLRDGGANLFQHKPDQSLRELQAQEAELYEQIGRLKMELEWLKKKCPESAAVRRALLEPDHPVLSLRRQCELPGLARATYYYQTAGESELNLCLMRLLDEQYLKTPFYGQPKLTAWLRQQGYAVNHNRVQRLLHLMGLQAIYPKPRTCVAAPGHKIYPYLLRGLAITRPNQVGSADIKYLPLPHGFMYLVAIIDWFSRYVLARQLSNMLDGRFCREALQHALSRSQPEIFNTDQGVQFTPAEFAVGLEAARIRISMDGLGRALDNIFVERLWRSLKYEDFYTKLYGSVSELALGLQAYFRFYNDERLHQSLAYRTPAQIHYAGAAH